MAKTKGGLFSIEARGTLGKSVTFQGGKSGQMVRKVIRQTVTHSAAQLYQRGLYKNACTMWGTLDQEAKDTWNAAAAGVRATGFNLYIQDYINNILNPTEIEIETNEHTEDNYIFQTSPTSNYGALDKIQIEKNVTGSQTGLIKWDLNDIISGPISEVIEAKVKLYYYLFTLANPAGKTVQLVRCTKTEVKEDQSNWNRYKIGSNWDTPGGDFDDETPEPGEVVMPGSYGWIEIEITALANDAVQNRGNVLAMGFRYAPETENSDERIFVRSSDYTTDAKRPILYIKYRP